MGGEQARDDRHGGPVQVIEAAEGALVRRPIEPQRLLAAVANADAGANVLFTGTARNHGAGGPTVGLVYETHEPMAGPALERLCTVAVERFRLVACALEHRLGRVAVGEVSVAVAASAPHRREAFAAAEWLMDRIKHEVPIWKCEERADGRREWIHPEPRAEAASGGRPADQAGERGAEERGSGERRGGRRGRRGGDRR
jgi:molybdopterin synthase catalytic subunit